MRLRLTHFDGLRIELQPGWYELPSHMPDAEVGRLVDLLAELLSGVEDLVECQWSELDEVALGPTTLVFVRVPEALEQDAVDARLTGIVVRLGLYARERGGHWPATAWDEIEVKRRLVAALRRTVAKPGHPLARFGIAELPVDLLAEATCEPIELLLLAEGTIAQAVRQHEEGAEVNWRQCVRWSIGRRLANRLAGESKRLARLSAEQLDSIRACIAESPDGTLRTLDYPHEIEALVERGLAHREQGDALLAPLARLVAEHQLDELLDLEGLKGPPRSPQPQSQSRAQSPSEAIASFDPFTLVTPTSPWFVDLRPLVPQVKDFARQLRAQLERRDRSIRLAVLQQPGSGGSTTLRQLFVELRAGGLVDIPVRAPAHGLGFVELLLRILSGLLARCAQRSELALEPSMLLDLRGWLAEYGLEGELREYVRLGTGVMETARLSSLLAILERMTSRAAVQTPEREQLRLRLEARLDELLDWLAKFLAQLRGQLLTRGQQPCIHIEGSEHLDPRTIDETFVAHAEDLARLDAHLVFSVGLATEHLAFQHPISATFPTLSYPDPANDPAGLRATLKAILSARAELDAVVAEPEPWIEALARRSHGNLRTALELAQGACERSEGEALTIGDLDPGEAELVEAELVLADEWPVIVTELERREGAGEDVHAHRTAIARGEDHGRVGPFGVLAGRYRLLEAVSERREAQVWRAWDRERQVQVAVKLLERGVDPRGLRWAFGSPQPGFVPILELRLDDDDGPRFFVMKWMEDGSLADGLDVDEDEFPLETDLEALATIAEALDVVHEAGLVHGQVQPDNILISDKHMALGSLDRLQTRVSPGKASVFVAPELIAGSSSERATVDVYGLGMSVLARVLGREPPPLVERTEPRLLDELECRPELSRAIRAAVAYDEGARAPSCRALAQALRGATEAEEDVEEAAPPPPPPRLSPSPPRGRPAPPPPAPPRRRWSRWWIAVALVAASVGGWLLFDWNRKLRAPPTGDALGVTRVALSDTDQPLRLIGLTGGAFTMGSGMQRHRVELPPFEICEAEVSVGQYRSVIGKPCESECDLPKTSVSWFDALKFMNALTRAENEAKPEGDQLTVCYDESSWAWDRTCTGYRLPTEAEWEYAARAGTTTKWWFGDDPADVCTHANVQEPDECPGKIAKIVGVTEKFPANPWGLHGVHGNVQEWVFDSYGAYDLNARYMPVVDRSGYQRVLRGGTITWDDSSGTRSASRNHYDPDARYSNVGFRCARGPIPPQPDDPDE